MSYSLNDYILRYDNYVNGKHFVKAFTKKSLSLSIYIYIYVIHKCLIHSPYLFDFSKVLVHGWHSDSRTDLRSNKVSVLSLNKLCYFTGEYKFRILLNAPKYFLLKIEVGLFKTCKMPVTFIIQSSTDALIVNAIWYVSNMVWRRNQSNYSLLPFISGP